MSPFIVKVSVSIATDHMFSERTMLSQKKCDHIFGVRKTISCVIFQVTENQLTTWFGIS